VVFGLLEGFYILNETACHNVKNFMTKTGIECSRQLLLHYRQRIEKNLNRLIMAVTEIDSLRAPPVTERNDVKKKVRQFLSTIHNPMNSSLKIFEQTRATYLTA
jgi:hypothetical protein